MAHLAGPLGARAWVVLQAVPDWRWLIERDDSPWYPTMRLFRQRAPGDWSAAVEFRGAHRRAGSSSSCATPSLASHVPVTHVVRPFALPPVEPAVTLLTARPLALLKCNKIL